MSAWYRWQDEDLILFCRLQPKASSDEIMGAQGDELKIRITAPPVDGKANQHLTGFLAKAFGVSKSRVCIEKGDTGRSKRIRIHAPTKIPAKLNIIKP